MAEIKNYTMNFGPQHPAAHGVLRLVLELDAVSLDGGHGRDRGRASGAGGGVRLAFVDADRLFDPAKVYRQDRPR